MSEPGPDHRLNQFLDRVEALLERMRELDEKRAEWKQKTDSLIMDLRQSEAAEEELQEELEQQRLSFSELAGEMEEEFKEIKQLAEQLTSRGTSHDT